MATPPPAARSHSLRSALLAQRAAAAAADAGRQGQPITTIAGVVATYQAASAQMAQTAVAQSLAQQAINEAAEALLNMAAFTTSAQVFEGMVNAVQDRRDLRFAVVDRATERTQAQYDAEFQRLVASLVQDAGRAAESVATAVRKDVAHVRLLTPPSCSRCVILAGRVYRYSDGFLRHPNCDCIMVPTHIETSLVVDPEALIRAGQVTGLSKADLRAVVEHGADLNQVVNVRRLTASMQQCGRVLARRGRLTPEGIYAKARTRDEAVELLAAAGYLL